MSGKPPVEEKEDYNGDKEDNSGSDSDEDGEKKKKGGLIDELKPSAGAWKPKKRATKV